MGQAMARTGGIGVLHRFMSIERQAAEVMRVKRAEGFIVDEPHSIDESATIADARARMAEYNIGGLVITDQQGRLLGLVTTRDLIFEPDQTRVVSEVMTPREQLITVQADTSLEEAREQLRKHRVEKLPVLDASGRLTGLITAQDIIKIDQWPQATKDKHGRLQIAAAVGIRSSDIERAAACVHAGADALGQVVFAHALGAGLGIDPVYSRLAGDRGGRADRLAVAARGAFGLDDFHCHDDSPSDELLGRVQSPGTQRDREAGGRDLRFDVVGSPVVEADLAAPLVCAVELQRNDGVLQIAFRQVERVGTDSSLADHDIGHGDPLCSWRR